mmetsp:Transcript_27688/g.64012  ORF Transcript_27688/g.64012 Transcript_27688/m.64012 type:complete len:201 (+) Transcript_27688:375-977(+)
MSKASDVALLVRRSRCFRQASIANAVRLFDLFLEFKQRNIIVISAGIILGMPVDIENLHTRCSIAIFEIRVAKLHPHARTKAVGRRHDPAWPNQSPTTKPSSSTAHSNLPWPLALGCSPSIHDCGVDRKASRPINLVQAVARIGSSSPSISRVAGVAIIPRIAIIARIARRGSTGIIARIATIATIATIVFYNIGTIPSG